MRIAIFICLLLLVFAVIAAPALAASGGEAVVEDADEIPAEEAIEESMEEQVLGEDLSDGEANPPPKSALDPASGFASAALGLLARYWWVLAVGAGGTAACLIAVKMRRPARAALAAAQEIPLTLRIGNTHHIGARESQQDSFGISDVSNAQLCSRKGVFGVVADGMGGMADGGEVSAIAARTMLQYFNEVAACEQPQLDLLNMVYAANDNVNRFLRGREKGGSTVVAVILRGAKLFWAAVGDSRIYLIRSGSILQINREHVYAVELDEKAATGEISWEEAQSHPQRGALTSYLGMEKVEKIDRNVRPMHLLAGDRVVLLSDGVFGVLTEDEILEAMASAPHESAEVLREKVLAKRNPSQDNFTAVILEVRSVQA